MLPRCSFTGVDNPHQLEGRGEGVAAQLAGLSPLGTVINMPGAAVPGHVKLRADLLRRSLLGVADHYRRRVLLRSIINAEAVMFSRLGGRVSEQAQELPVVALS